MVPRSAVAPLPDECWQRVLSNLEATELSGCISSSCQRMSKLSENPELWQMLLRVDFSASFTHRAMLLTWMAMHRQFHPRQLYVFKRREHLLDLEIARNELQQRGEQAREQERKQRRLRALNYFLVRFGHCLFCLALVASSTLLWLKLLEVLNSSFYIILAPFFAFEAFVLMSAAITFAIYLQRSSTGWTFYWNRLQGTIRWFILLSSPFECLLVLIFGLAVVPLTAATLEKDLRLPWPHFVYLPPFLSFWLAVLTCAASILRRRSCSSSCVGSSLFLWIPLGMFSALLFLRLSVCPWLPPVVMLMPILLVTGALIIFSGFLSMASFWLGWRGSRDWMEYASTTLVVILTVLLPLLAIQLALVGYLRGLVQVNWVFAPWTCWLSGLLGFTLWQSFVPLKPASAALDMPRYWRHQDLHSDAESLLPP
ncbi:unnamed protein product [Symbiodinium necroappetens]|uniref:F-box domain-containing protein n=1 Tax=Symbiodinium necroappetens TaxID=1628268 RepID=A0A812VRS2_9DINO|nr:unnamed protein product [Symbiodinium necroappetens]